MFVTQAYMQKCSFMDTVSKSKMYSCPQASFYLLFFNGIIQFKVVIRVRIFHPENLMASFSDDFRGTSFAIKSFFFDLNCTHKGEVQSCPNSEKYIILTFRMSSRNHKKTNNRDEKERHQERQLVCSRDLL